MPVVVADKNAARCIYVDSVAPFSYCSDRTRPSYASGFGDRFEGWIASRVADGPERHRGDQGAAQPNKVIETSIKSEDYFLPLYH